MPPAPFRGPRLPVSVIAVVGAQWGDEGKGRVVDYLAAEAALVIRYGGGNNAGHTVVNPHGHFKLHLVPSGIFHRATRNLLGNGVVIHPPALLAELDHLAAAGFDCSSLMPSGKGWASLSGASVAWWIPTTGPAVRRTSLPVPSAKQPTRTRSPMTTLPPRPGLRRTSWMGTRSSTRRSSAVTRSCSRGSWARC